MASTTPVRIGITHDAYGKRVMAAAAPGAFTSEKHACRVDYGPDAMPAFIDGVVGGRIAVEIEARTIKQIRGAVLDLANHSAPYKLLVVVPSQNLNTPHHSAVANLRNALGRLVESTHFRVVLLRGTGESPELEADIETVRVVLRELGWLLEVIAPA